MHAADASAVDGLNGIVARLGALEATVSERLGALGAQWEAHARESKQLGQLLASSFSLGLSLQEQQVRSTTALCALAQRLERLEERASEPAYGERAGDRTDDLHDWSARGGRAKGKRATAERPRAPKPIWAVEEPPTTTSALRRALQDMSQQQETLLAEVRRLQRRRQHGPGHGVGRRPGLRLGARARGSGGRDAAARGRSPSATLPAELEKRRPAAPPAAACILCESAPANAVLYRCGHRCACLQCAHYLRHERLACPLCRAPIDDVVRIFE
jgi:hypothetical protein